MERCSTMKSAIAILLMVVGLSILVIFGLHVIEARNEKTMGARALDIGRPSHDHYLGRTMIIVVAGIAVETEICPRCAARIYPSSAMDSHIERHDWLDARFHGPGTRRGNGGKHYRQQNQKRMSSSGIEKHEGIRSA